MAHLNSLWQKLHLHPPAQLLWLWGGAGRLNICKKALHATTGEAGLEIPLNTNAGAWVGAREGEIPVGFPPNHETNSKAKFNCQSSEWETFQPLGSLGLMSCLALPCCPPVPVSPG